MKTLTINFKNDEEFAIVRGELLKVVKEEGTDTFDGITVKENTEDGIILEAEDIEFDGI